MPKPKFPDITKPLADVVSEWFPSIAPWLEPAPEITSVFQVFPLLTDALAVHEKSVSCTVELPSVIFMWPLPLAFSVSAPE